MKLCRHHLLSNARDFTLHTLLIVTNQGGRPFERLAVTPIA